MWSRHEVRFQDFLTWSIKLRWRSSQPLAKGYMSQLGYIDSGKRTRSLLEVQPQRLPENWNPVAFVPLVIQPPPLPGQLSDEDSILRHQHSILRFGDREDLYCIWLLCYLLRISSDIHHLWYCVTSIPTVFEICELHIDLRLTPNIVNHTRCYVGSQSGVDVR